MIKYFCDKCGDEIGVAVTYKAFSLSKCQEVQLCARCNRKLNKVLKEADRKFFETEIRGAK